MEHTNLYINGAWVEGADKVRFDVTNPATEEVLTSVASAELADADAALALQPGQCGARRALGIANDPPRQL